jgi:4-hydroxybenzoate polyprenyltransferase
MITWDDPREMTQNTQATDSIPAASAVAAALRVHQWVKNLLVFAAPVLAHRLDSLTLFQAFQAFAALSLASSAAYVLNDLSDLESDRMHPTKSRRPFASGALPVSAGWILFPVLLTGACAIALWAGLWLFFWVVGYAAVTVAYSFWLKKMLAVDLVVLSGLYCARVLAGGLATGIPISPWTFAFAMFLFFSIALLKRYAELHNRKTAGRFDAAGGRAYRVDDMPVLAALGAASAMTSVLVIALYLNGDEVRRLYPHADLLWVICLLVLLWHSRVWLLANRGGMEEDPVLFAIRDRWSLLLACAVIGLLVISSR